MTVRLEPRPRAASRSMMAMGPTRENRSAMGMGSRRSARDGPAHQLHGVSIGQIDRWNQHGRTSTPWADSAPLTWATVVSPS